MDKILYSRGSDEWETPASLFKALDREFHFDLDPCATPGNAKCKRFFSIDDDGLTKSWGGCTVFCNPPYSKVSAWVRKCQEEGTKPGTTVVMLVPARTDTKWFHNYVYHRSEVRFVKGRLRFGDAQYNAPFPSMIVIYRAAGEYKRGGERDGDGLL